MPFSRTEHCSASEPFSSECTLRNLIFSSIDVVATFGFCMKLMACGAGRSEHAHLDDQVLTETAQRGKADTRTWTTRFSRRLHTRTHKTGQFCTVQRAAGTR